MPRTGTAAGTLAARRPRSNRRPPGGSASFRSPLVSSAGEQNREVIEARPAKPSDAEAIEDLHARSWRENHAAPLTTRSSTRTCPRSGSESGARDWILLRSSSSSNRPSTAPSWPASSARTASTTPVGAPLSTLFKLRPLQAQGDRVVTHETSRSVAGRTAPRPRGPSPGSKRPCLGKAIL